MATRRNPLRKTKRSHRKSQRKYQGGGKGGCPKGGFHSGVRQPNGTIKCSKCNRTGV